MTRIKMDENNQQQQQQQQQQDKDKDKELIEKLLRMVKREVKQIMEEAVTRKFVHEDSGCITSLCAAVDACLSHGLKRRALGLFKTNSTTALLQKVAKNCDSALLVLKKVQEIESLDPNKRSSSSSDSLQSRNRMSFKMKSSTSSQNQQQIQTSITNNNSINNNCINQQQQQQQQSPIKYRFLWIRIALFEKYLVSIVDHVVENNQKYYERDALVSDPVAGQILASLLVGPCALDYTKMKTNDQYWIDPPADELVQRHRITSSTYQQTNNSLNQSTIITTSSTIATAAAAAAATTTTTTNQSTPPSSRKPLCMNYRKNFSTDYHFHQFNNNNNNNNNFNNDNNNNNIQSPILHQSTISTNNNICWSPKDYVESLHQNSKSTLLYGKNNVIMQPIDDQEPMPGYLSLHQDSMGLSIKWTPNQLINGRINQETNNENNFFNHSLDKSGSFWNYALNVNVENIVYLHCHQQNKHDNGSIVMVGRDGVMHPPIKFPKGGHLLSFLSCLENGLIPYGQLDPPLWTEKGKGKIFPKLRRKSGQSSLNNNNINNNNEHDDDIAADYVFRVISILDKPDTISAELFEPKLTKQQQQQPEQRSKLDKTKDENKQSKQSELTSSTSLSYETNEQQQLIDVENIQLLCDTMKKQIISRAFYGWLAYCRHLNTVRTHLADLVNQRIYRINEPNDASKGITEELWNNHIFDNNGRFSMDPMEFYRLIYFGGIEHSIRSKVWLYLLEHYRFDDDNQRKQEHDRKIHEKYEMIMSEWLAVEAIVRQRDKEIVAANLAKLSSESQNDNDISTELTTTATIDKTTTTTTNEKTFINNNDVFEEKNETTTINSRKSSIQQNNDNDNDETYHNNNNNNNNRKQLIRHNKINNDSIIINNNVHHQNIFITNPSVDRNNGPSPPNSLKNNDNDNDNDNDEQTINLKESNGGDGSQCVSPASSNGGLYSNELLDLFSLNLHRIDKDVQRCDRNFWYFTKENLEKLRNIMCTYVWDNLDVGYVQGMCDLLAPLLVIFDDEVYTYSCFCKLMIRMTFNFPHGGAMDTHFANLRILIQILDSDIFELMHQNGDYTHFYFCYRWFLLDFKRELLYADVFTVWETIWSAKHVSSSSFVLFIALALVEYYRDIILENNMDFTDIIKFFNEMAERHDAKAVLNLARDLVHQIQLLLDTNK